MSKNQSQALSSGHADPGHSDPGHGDSVASWATVIIVMIATAVGTLAFWFDLAIVVWISAAVAIVSVPIGILLKRAGYGVGGEKSKKNH